MQLEDEVVAHFCVPCLGLAVPICPGDLLVFNAQEAHCLSSICNKEDSTIYGVARYLKSKVASLNDNSIPLTGFQDVMYNVFKNRKAFK